MRQPWRNRALTPVRALALTFILAAGACPAPTQAQELGATETPERQWWNVWTTHSTEDRIMWFMSTLHLHHVDEGLSNDGLGGVVYRGVYAASFLTTHGPRAATVGFERRWISGELGPLGGMLGFRTGLIYGYDGRLGWMAEAVPVLPFAQPVIYGRAGPVSLDLTYTWVVVSMTAGFRF